MKNKLKNISANEMPVDGTDLKVAPGEVVKVELTERLRYLINNKIFEDLGEVKEEEVKEPEPPVPPPVEEKVAEKLKEEEPNWDNHEEKKAVSEFPTKSKAKIRSRSKKNKRR